MRNMGTCYSFVSTEKIKDLGAFSRKLEHNFRIGGRVPNADPMKSYLNEELIKLEPGSDYIKEYNKRVLDSAYYQTHKIRKDAVRGIEVMMTFSSKDIPKDFDFEQWKKENVEWLQSYFGKDNVVSAVLHMDETTPHIHAVVIPMVNERLSAAHFLNGRERMANLQNSYGDRMEKLGLTRGMKGSLAKHTDIKEFYTAVNKQKIKELPQPKKHESTKDYYERAQKVFQESNYQHLNELQKKDREIIEKNTQTLQENLELANSIKKTQELIREIEHRFGEDKNTVLKKIDTMNHLNQGLKSYPDQDFSNNVFEGMREILRFEKEKTKRTRKEPEKSLDQILDEAKKELQK